MWFSWKRPPLKVMAKRPRHRWEIVALATILAVAGVVLGRAWHADVRRLGATVVSSGTGPAETLLHAIIEDRAGEPGDPGLMRAYQEINERYFAGGLPKIPVLWERRLGELAPLTAGGFTREGLAADRKGKIFILLNPVISSNQAKLRRALCHEMVHVYLYAQGDMTTNHGPAFQAVLQRLLAAGAFQAISATPDEKLYLKSWLEDESRRLDADSAELERGHAELDQLGGEITREKSVIEQETQGLYEPVSHSNEEGYDQPAADNVEGSRRRALDQRIADFNARVNDFNASVTRHRSEVERFNQELDRYNLMMAYPDGLDENSTMEAKTEVRPKD